MPVMLIKARSGAISLELRNIQVLSDLPLGIHNIKQPQSNDSLHLIFHDRVGAESAVHHF